MKTLLKNKAYVFAVATFLAVAMAQQVHAHGNHDQSHVAIGGYDTVTYCVIKSNLNTKKEG